jgi:alpha-ribazole phosphatase
MKIIAVRHTSVDVADGICYGQSDVATASTFEKEKEMVVQKLMQEQYQAVYSSPLSRCRKLAGFVAKGNPIIYDARLMELNFGKWEGCRWDDIYNSEESQRWFDDWVNTPCPGGESNSQLVARVEDFLQQVTPQHSDETILVVTHGGVVRALISLLSNIELQKTFEIQVDFGSVVKLETICSPTDYTG